MEAFRAALDEHGFVAIGGALGSDELVALTDAVETIHRRRGGGAVHELGFLGVDERFIAMVDHPAVLPLVVSVLGWNIYMYHCHLDVQPPSEERRDGDGIRTVVARTSSSNHPAPVCR